MIIILHCTIKQKIQRFFIIVEYREIETKVKFKRLFIVFIYKCQETIYKIKLKEKTINKFFEMERGKEIKIKIKFSLKEVRKSGEKSNNLKTAIQVTLRIFKDSIDSCSKCM